MYYLCTAVSVISQFLPLYNNSSYIPITQATAFVVYHYLCTAILVGYNGNSIKRFQLYHNHNLCPKISLVSQSVSSHSRSACITLTAIMQPVVQSTTQYDNSGQSKNAYTQHCFRMVGIKTFFHKKSKRQVITNISLPGAEYDRKIFSYNKASIYSATEVVPSSGK